MKRQTATAVRMCAVIAFLAITAGALARDHHYPYAGHGLKDVEATDFWDLSGVYLQTGNAVYDTPVYVWNSATEVSEIIGGRRQRYREDGGLWVWTGEETPLMKISGDSLYDSGDKCAGMRFHAAGDYCGNRVTESGTYELLPPATGRVFTGRDTISVILRGDRRDFRATIGEEGDSAMSASERYVITRYRWFVRGGREPIAVQTALAVYGSDGREERSISRLYVLDHDETEAIAEKATANTDPGAGSDDDRIRRLFEQARIESSGGRTTVTLPGAPGADTEAGVSTLGGIFCVSSTADGTADVTEINIDTAGLHPGQYVLGLKSGRVQVKHLFVIR